MQKTAENSELYLTIVTEDTTEGNTREDCKNFQRNFANPSISKFDIADFPEEGLNEA